MSKNALAVLLAAAMLLISACGKNADRSADTKAAAPADNASAVEDDVQYGPISAQALTDRCNAEIKRASAKLDALEKMQPPYTVASVLVPLNELGIAMAGGFGASSLYVNLSPLADVRTAGQGCEQAWNELNTRLGLSRPVYDAVSAVDVSQEDPETQFSVAKLLRDFKRSGVDRDEATRKRVSELQDEILKLGQEFDKNLAEDVRHIELDSSDQLAGLPQDYIDAHAPDESGKIVVTTDYPDAIPFFDYAQDDDARKALRAVYDNRAYPANEALLKELITRRHELATLLGYRNWAHYVTEDKMIGSPDRAL
jgi:thimet oligopeptidase